MATSRNTPVVVVTGASAGVGRAVVRRFAKDGVKIGLIARGMDGLRATAREVEDLGSEPLILPCDVADNDAVEAAAQKVEDTFGPIDIWINVAFAGILSRFIDIEPKDYERVTQVTYLGQINGARAALRRMVARNKGVLVLTGSALAYRGIPLQSAYCGAKHAIQGFQDSIRSELIHDDSDVHVTMVQLPGVNTPQFDWMKTNLPNQPRPASPPYQPEVAAEAIHLAAHHRRKEVQVGVSSWEAIWANKFFSPILDRYLARTGFSGQQGPDPVRPDRQNNLYEPVPGDHGAHGRFDSTAKSWSPQLVVTKNRNLIAAGVAAAALSGLVALAKQVRR